MKRLAAACVCAGAIGAVLAVRSVFPSMAEEDSSRAAYYRSVQIQSGDSLWNIASRYRGGSDMSMEEYMETLRRMNRLKEDTIHAGQYLTILYYK